MARSIHLRCARSIPRVLCGIAATNRGMQPGARRVDTDQIVRRGCGDRNQDASMQCNQLARFLEGLAIRKGTLSKILAMLPLSNVHKSVFLTRTC
jgi:hypothetical protein